MSADDKPLIYAGDGLGATVRFTWEDAGGGTHEETLFPYLPDRELVNAVNLSILLRRPLLLMGEPGCGKSLLAKAVAYELYGEQYPLHYFEWLIKSSTKAREGLYEYDAIRRLGDAQVLRQSKSDNALPKEDYIEDGPLGLAIRRSTPQRPAVLLIDEVDKADLDFSNDLLNELDRGEYTIAETQQTFRAGVKPIVIITSNQEKELPDAFLRRCVYHYIDPLGPELLQDILLRRFYRKEPSEEEQQLIERVVALFLDIRKELQEKKLTVGKNISTSELIDWFEVIKHYRALAEKDGDEKRKKQLKGLLEEWETFKGDKKNIPFRQVLFKNYNTLLNFKKN